MGFELASVLEEAGLVVEEVRAEAVIHTARAHAKGHHSIGTIVRFMVPRIVAQGVATEGELDVATLDERLLEERTRANAVFISDMMFGAWARKPGLTVRACAPPPALRPMLRASAVLSLPLRWCRPEGRRSEALGFRPAAWNHGQPFPRRRRSTSFTAGEGADSIATSL